MPRNQDNLLGDSSVFPIERDVRVHTSWDLGYTDATAIWFIQAVGRERRLVDYYEGSGMKLSQYVSVLHEKREKSLGVQRALFPG